MAKTAEVLPFLVWSKNTNVLERRPVERDELVRMFRQMDA